MPFINEAFVEDPRDGLERLRRGTLARICREAGLQFDESKTGATSYRRMIRENGIDFTKYLGEAHKLGVKEPAQKKMARLDKEKAELEAKVDTLTEQVTKLLEMQANTQLKVEQKDEIPEKFEGLPIWQLRKLCKTLGVESQNTDKAEDLVRKLNEHTASGG
jgi:hypothetical protein